jgi:hypothetical protein
LTYPLTKIEFERTATHFFETVVVLLTTDTILKEEEG